MASATTIYDFKPLNMCLRGNARAQMTVIASGGALGSRNNHLPASPRPSGGGRAAPSLRRPHSTFVTWRESQLTPTPDAEKGEETPLSDYKGKVVLVVNTASKCGFTPQYAGLEALYKKITEKYPEDFTILGFPCNQFGGQEPGTDDDIQNFCQVNYGVTFPIMKKVDVNGDNADPLFKWLKEEMPGIMGLKRVKWNFEKFLIGRDGKVKGRWASTTKPESLEKDILKEIEAPKPSI
ncbi:uncharacterized protein PgNI_02408 [Pyricularia grisea]|uniref:Glutathione peroxidase n=1 Tax=Pyricularia grisea TaxID=148305 RepID=A0A6P8BLN6_PYRGI|nr:uncharacterized protein PgNI_02408 [Pyricularia grisea]TLD17550.1 hypothetical protein PgNI_02408 [Pyricularia grisea]